MKILQEFHAGFLRVIEVAQHAHMFPVYKLMIGRSKYAEIGIHCIAFQNQRCFVAVRDIHVLEMSRDKEFGF